MLKTRRLAYDAAFKLKAIKRASEIGNRATAKELGINESMVWKWRKQNRVKQKDWVDLQRADGRGISTTQLRLKAIDLSKSSGRKGSPYVKGCLI